MNDRKIIEVGGKRYKAVDRGCDGCAFQNKAHDDRLVDNWWEHGYIGQPDACGVCIDRNIFVAVDEGV